VQIQQHRCRFLLRQMRQHHCRCLWYPALWQVLVPGLLMFELLLNGVLLRMPAVRYLDHNWVVVPAVRLGSVCLGLVAVPLVLYRDWLRLWHQLRPRLDWHGLNQSQFVYLGQMHLWFRQWHL